VGHVNFLEGNLFLGKSSWHHEELRRFCPDTDLSEPSCIQTKTKGFTNKWVFPKIGVFPPKWMVKIMENPIKMDDLGVPLFSETSKCWFRALQQRSSKTESVKD